ncbi:MULTISPECIES: M48 family metallopeptidase [unclassified Thioalkalivibrio]|uniref:M48 family metallopeptidase n=1 Tax=unclassified Thioalkalivibrio TaxID=2621013 RepID=UPI000375F2E1|nr:MULTISPECIES: SprT family zinc-dependent metalloprotease [unclassified Thioalkalivibrio]
MMTRRVGDIEYQLLPGNQRRTTDIVIERDGRVVVRPPAQCSPEQVDAVVASKRLWIYRNLAEWKDLNGSAVAREWVNGETFMYLGAGYRLALVSEQEQPLTLKDGRFRLRRDVVEQGRTRAAREAFEQFYTEKAQQRFEDRVSFFAPKVGVEVGKVKVKDMGYRWASCGRIGTLNFHWKCMMAPPKIVDYIIVHELCHLHQGNHTEAFWNEVDKVLPDCRERKEWLRRYGASLDI